MTRAKSRRSQPASPMIRRQKATSKSLHKKAMEHIDSCLKKGVQISVLGVARDLGISNWIFYKVPEVRHYIQTAIAEQRSNGLAPFPSDHSSNETSHESLRSENAMFRSKIGEMEAALAKYKKRLQTHLGDEIGQTSNAELLERIEELEQLNDQASRELEARHREVSALNIEVENLQDQVAAHRHAQGIMMRQLSIQRGDVDQD